MKTFVLNRATWFRGVKSVHGSQHSLTDNVMRLCAWRQFINSLEGDAFYNDLKRNDDVRFFSMPIIEVNDDPNTSDDFKIEHLTKIFVGYGFEMRVRDDPVR